MKSPDVRFLAWSIFALALSLPATAWVWSHGERSTAPTAPTAPTAQTIILPAAPASPTSPSQQTVARDLVRIEEARVARAQAKIEANVPVDFMDVVVAPKGKGAEVRYTVNRDAQVWVDILSPSGDMVSAVGKFPASSRTQYARLWDGKGADGKIAPLRHYQLQIVAEAKGRTVLMRKPMVLPTFL